VRGGGPPLIAIGASTGGVEALREVLAAFPANCPPTLIVQHMRARFVEGFVERLDRLCAPKVRPAAADARLEPGTIHIATGDTVHLVAMGLTQPRCALVEDGLVSGHRPSVDMLFRSLVPFAPSVVAALLTGMGRDGASGMLALRRAGAFTICQDQETSVVYGMPRAASEMGAVDRELPLDRIGMAILKASRRIAA
jgi:two-component system chemotaxis response regulator CheB